MSTAGNGQWMWYSDSGWVPFSDALNDEIEKGYKAKKDRVKVDDQRFVDLKQLLQRRYDDENKCRMVKREIKPSFDGCVVALSGPFSKAESDVIRLISDNGGLVAQFITPKVSMVICSKSVTSITPNLAEAQALGISIVVEDVIDDIIRNGAKNVDFKNYTASLPASSSSASMSAPLSSSSPSNTSVLAVVSPFERASKWSGVYTDPSGAMMPVELIVTLTHNSSGAFLSELKRPTLKNLKTKVLGTFNGSALILEEVSLISGGASGKLPTFPNKFTGTVSNKQAKVCSTADPSSTLELTLVPNARVAGAKMVFPMLSVGSTFQGQLTQTTPFEITFNQSSDASKLNGTMLMQGESFPFTGTASGQNLTITHPFDDDSYTYTLSAPSDTSGNNAVTGSRKGSDGVADVKITL